MADRGKAPMDPRQEEAEERSYREQQRLREERMRMWWGSWEQSPLSRPPIPHVYWHYDFMMSGAIGIPRGPDPFYPQGNLPTPSNSITPEPASSSHPVTVRTAPREDRPVMQLPKRRRWFLQDIERANMEMYWAQYNEPVPPETGPWFRFSQGFCNFRFGVTAKEIAEKEHWLERELMARGENQDPPTPDEESIIISFKYSEDRNNPNEAEAKAEIEVEAEMEAEAEVEVEVEMEADNNEEAREEEDEEANEDGKDMEEADESELQSTITDAPSLM